MTRNESGPSLAQSVAGYAAVTSVLGYGAGGAEGGSGGGRRDEVRPRVVAAVRPSVQPHHREVEVQPLCFAYPHRALTGGHAVAERHVDGRDEAGVARLAHRPVEDVPHRHRPVEDGDGERRLGARLEHVLQRGEVCVAPDADVAEVDDYAPDAFEHLRRRLAVLAVQGVDREVPERMPRAGGVLARRGGPEETVLGRVERLQPPGQRGKDPGRRARRLHGKKAQRLVRLRKTGYRLLVVYHVVPPLRV